MRELKVTRKNPSDECEHIQAAPHFANFGDGPIPVSPASGLSIGQMLAANGSSACAITLRTSDFAITLLIDPVQGRAVASGICGVADAIEASAAIAADAAIERARGK